MLPVTKRNTFLVALSILLTSIGEPIPLPHAALNAPALAQSVPSPSGPVPFPLPTAVPSGTKVTVDGSSSMENINKALKEQFENKFTGTEVVILEGGTDAALQALRDGKIDLAALGRPLTAAEKAEGFKEYPVTRHKIAMIVGPDNPFNGSLTIDQFAQIFRGEIKDWSKVGGTAGPIRMIDRPESSDTRQTFNNYPVFQKAPLQTGDTATTVAEDQTDLVVTALGKDGIGYAIADQVEGRSDVRILKMHDTLPSDQRYPFSQVLLYVYRGDQPSNAAKAFLGYATAKDNAAAIEEARKEEVAVAPSPEVAASPAPVEERERGGFPWWLLLLLIPLAFLLPFLLKSRPEPEPEAIRDPAPVPPPPPPPVPLAPSRLILTPRDCRNAYAYWEVPSERLAELQRAGGRKLTLRLYDATDLDLDRQEAHRVEEFECNEWDQDLHVPIAVDDRDYVAELGYVTEDGNWLPVAKSDGVRVPACPPQEVQEVNIPTAVAATTAAATAATMGAATLTTPGTATSRIILTPRNCKEAYAYWEVPEEHKAALRSQGGERLMVRLYDVTNVDLDNQSPHSVQEYECGELDRDLHISIPVDDRDYIAELGYKAVDGSWYSLARSLHVRVPSCNPVAGTVESGTATAGSFVQTGTQTGNLFETDRDRVDEIAPSEQAQTARERAGDFFESGRDALENLFDTARDKIDDIRTPDIDDSRRTGSSTVTAGGAAIASGLGAAAGGIRSFFDDDTEDRNLQEKISLRWRSLEEALVTWNITAAEKEAVRQMGGQRLALRVYDMTDTNLDGQPDSIWEYDCDELETEKLVRIYSGDRDYVAELGYITEEGRWLPLAKSNVLRVD